MGGTQTPMRVCFIAVVALVARHQERLQPCRQHLGLHTVALLAWRGQLPVVDDAALTGLVLGNGRSARTMPVDLWERIEDAEHPQKVVSD